MGEARALPLERSSRVAPPSRFAIERALHPAAADPRRSFRYLLLAQWTLGVGLVLWLMPWAGSMRSGSPLLGLVLVGAGMLNLLPLLLARREMHEMLATAERLEKFHELAEREVAQRTLELTRTAERFRALVENTKAMPWELSLETNKLVYAPPQAASFFGSSETGLYEPGFLRSLVHPQDARKVAKRISGFVENRYAAAEEMEYRMLTPDGRTLYARTFLYPGTEDGVVRGMTFDVTQQKQTEIELHQAQKLEAVGRLAAGVAHEINTPIQFVSDSMYFVQEAANDLFAVVDSLQAVKSCAARREATKTAIAEAEETEVRVDLDRLREHVPKALQRALEGLERVSTIVRSMKNYSHPGHQEMSPADLNTAIQSTLVIARNEYKYVAEVHTELGDIPEVTCQIGDLNQVVLNLVVNAAHAIEERVKGSSELGRITVRTRVDGRHAIIEIGDTGGGIPDAIASKVFDPFFTTKEVGRGTGQGLALAHATVVERHGGELRFDSVPGVGTVFFVRIPIDGVTRKKRVSS